jgi:hypothetical protein
MADKVPGQCDRCVPVLDTGDERVFFCDAHGVPAIEIYMEFQSGGMTHYAEPIDSTGGCGCVMCVECWVICYRRGLISKALMDRLSTELGLDNRVRDALRA